MITDIELGNGGLAESLVAGKTKPEKYCGLTPCQALAVVVVAAVTFATLMALFLEKPPGCYAPGTPCVAPENYCNTTGNTTESIIAENATSLVQLGLRRLCG